MSEQTSSPIRVVLADDHALVVEGLRGLLAYEPDIEVVAAVTDGDMLLSVLQRERPDVVVLDLQMPTRDGFSCLASIREANIPVKVVILSAFGDGGSLQSAWELHADGFALKTDPPRQTVSTIRNVARGQIVFPHAVRRTVTPSEAQSPLNRLTDRERDVLVLLADGMTNAQIADQLVIQESTVKYHLQNVFQKLGVVNRTEAAQVYYREKRDER